MAFCAQHSLASRAWRSLYPDKGWFRSFSWLRFPIASLQLFAFELINSLDHPHQSDTPPPDRDRDRDRRRHNSLGLGYAADAAMEVEESV
jgi:hypothetical protein